jgi:large subunit ribosomal protein L22
MAFQVKAVTKYVGVSAQKVRLVVNQVRGMDAGEALTLLKFMTQAAALPVSKTLHSAVANAEENFGMNREDLVVSQIFADEAPTRKWRRFGARGRFKPILKRTSHITVIVQEREA